MIKYGTTTKYTTGKNVSEHYSLIKDSDMTKIPMLSICDDKECVLYLWVTGPVLCRAIRIAEAWGFNYRTVAFVWQKCNKVLPGSYTMSSCEYVLAFGRKNTTLPRRSVFNARQFFQEPPTYHSAKPDYVQNTLDLMYPNYAKVELFARRERPGWDAFGNEIGNKEGL
jgi:N6-adenosine-specific RNA methylase IME4